MLNSLFKFFKGYVIIEVYGCGVERLVNICTHRNIGVGAIKRRGDGSVLLRIRGRDLKRLRPIVRKTHTKIHIVRKCGIFGFRKRLGARIGFAIGAVLAALFFVIAPRFIWTVKIEGTEDIDRAAIEQTLKEIGIYRGAPKSKLADGVTIKRQIMEAHPSLLWAWAYVKGSNATVRVYEKALPPQTVDRQSPCDIVAAHDAYIESIDVLNGYGAVESGATVKAGELLISGEVPVYKEGEEAQYMYVRAMGRIRAYTERTKSGVYSLTRRVSKPTGRREIKRYIDLFGKRINLYRSAEPSFGEYEFYEETHDLSGIRIGALCYEETEYSDEPMSVDYVLATAKEELEEKIAKELCRDAHLQGSELQYEWISQSEIRVRLIMSFTEDIGTEVPTERNGEHIDKQTN